MWVEKISRGIDHDQALSPGESTKRPEKKSLHSLRGNELIQVGGCENKMLPQSPDVLEGLFRVTQSSSEVLHVPEFVHLGQPEGESGRINLLPSKWDAGLCRTTEASAIAKNVKAGATINAAAPANTGNLRQDLVEKTHDCIPELKGSYIICRVPHSYLSLMSILIIHCYG